MTRRKSNGFMLSGDSRRPGFEAETGRGNGGGGGGGGGKRPVDRTDRDWNRMPHDEQDRRKHEGRRHDEPIMPPPGLNLPAHAQHATQQRQKQRVVSQLEKELIERARERGVNRHTARQTLVDRLTWRGADTLESIRLRQWNLVVLSDNWVAKHAPEEICCFAIDNGVLTQQLRIVARAQDFEPYNPPSSQSGSRFTCWNPHSPGDVNHVSVQLCKFFQGAWSNLILMPAHQMSQLASLLHWMKEIRDTYCRRDTTSIRLDRLMCLEDVISVFRVLHQKASIDSDDDESWEQLQEIEITDTMLYGRAACEYFASSLAKCAGKPTTTDIETQVTAYAKPTPLATSRQPSPCDKLSPTATTESLQGVQGEKHPLSASGNSGSHEPELQADDAIDTHGALSDHEDAGAIGQAVGAAGAGCLEKNAGFGRARFGGFSRNPFAVAAAAPLYRDKDETLNVRNWLMNIDLEDIEPMTPFEPFWDQPSPLAGDEGPL